MKISVIGQGYVGLPLALAAANVGGYMVVGIDTNQSLIKTLNSGLSPIGDVSSEEIVRAQTSKLYEAVQQFDQVKDSDIVVICVPTPLDSSNHPDLSILLNAVNSVSKNLKQGALVIVESTVSPGTVRSLVDSSLMSSGLEYDLAYSPERIDPANRKWTVTNTPKLVAGMTQSATNRAAMFYSSFIDTVIQGSSIEVVETAKLLENSFRLINIAFINEIAEFCWKLGIDVREVIDAAATKPYGFMPFYPSAGVGGHCIPVDPSYLAVKAKEIGSGTRFIDLANDINRSLPAYFTERATGILGTLKNKKVLLIGVAYKPNVSDVRETPALGLIQGLRQAGAEVAWHDNLVGEWMGEKSSPLSGDYDLVILVNPQSKLDLSALGTTPILDTNGGH
jgi:nucleotide sugar dehydrogenase